MAVTACLRLQFSSWQGGDAFDLQSVEAHIATTAFVAYLTLSIDGQAGWLSRKHAVRCTSFSNLHAKPAAVMW